MPKKYQPLGCGMTPCKTKLGRFLRARRIEIELRQVQVAKSLGMPQTSYSGFEIGRQRYLDSQKIEDLARVLQCKISRLRSLVPKRRRVEPKTEFGRFIRSRREQLGLTWQDLAERLRVSRERAHGLEVGTQQGIRYRLLKPLTHALDLELSTFSRFIGTREKVTSSILGQLVRSRRKEFGLSQEGLAKKLRVTRQFMSQIESGRIPLSIGHTKGDVVIERLAKVLKLDIARLQALRPRRRLKQKKVKRTILSGFLTARRLELEITQREVAKRVGKSARAICYIEMGRTRPNTEMLNRLAKALECEIPLGLKGGL